LKAGWPEEALAVLPLANEDTAWLAEREDRLKLVSFTGSAHVGWNLKAKSGRKRVALELGGNAAMILHSDWRGPDMDLDQTLDAVASGWRMEAFGYCGAELHFGAAGVCGAADFSDVLWKLVDRATKMVRGNPADEATEIGPVIRPADADRIESWVKEALEAGAKLVEGGGGTGEVDGAADDPDRDEAGNEGA
jgi:acyl-CoA reductase-like NAD-dependent aldehyde dehydrogenase